jgi:hypothetical protein
MFCGGLQETRLLARDAMLSGEFCGIVGPHGLLAIAATTLLLNQTIFSDFGYLIHKAPTRIVESLRVRNGMKCRSKAGAIARASRLLSRHKPLRRAS